VPGQRILVAHADGTVAAALRTALSRRGYRVATATEPRVALAICRTQQPIDLAVVDLAVAGMDGAELGARLRVMGASAVIVLADRGDLAGRAAALSRGADDYVVKPVSMTELLGRAAVVLRRVVEPASAIQVGRIRIDAERRVVTIDGAAVTMPRKERELLAELARAGGAVVSRQRLLVELWHTDWQQATQSITVHVSTLRRKLGGAARIESVRGVGYRLVTETD
jgi:DNA-binding response OmpR family regulator